MMSYKELALRHTYTCFFNSLLREIDFYTLQDNGVEIHLPGQSLILGLKRASLVGRHEYTGEFFHSVRNIRTSISFFAALDILLPFLFKNPKEDNTQLIAVFKKRLENSLHNMELSLESRRESLDRLFEEDLSFEQAEQGLFIGHNFHPYPKMREGFSDDDYRKYSPEMGGAFKLVWLAFAPQSLTQFRASKFSDIQWTHTLADYEGIAIPAGMAAYPCHPWQLKVLEKTDRLKGLEFQVLGEGRNTWFPTSSLRSIYSPGAPYMLKFSLTLKLTNSIRHLTDVEVVRGMQVFDVLASQKGQEFRQKYPEFEVISEPAYIGIQDVHGKLMNDTLVVARLNPFTNEHKNTIVVSTLAQDNPLGKANLINRYIDRYSKSEKISPREAALSWFRDYLRVAVAPLIDAQANFGFLLGAHQQNLILEIKNNRPAKGYFRDCQGTGYNQTGYAFYKDEVPSMTLENGNILGEMGNILFAYYLIINSSFNVIAAIAQDGSISESELLNEMKTFLQNLRSQKPLDPSFLDYVLNRELILQKGNFFCSLDNINENTTENPLALYNLIPNPLYAGAPNVTV